jgi:hypothetical protein
MVTVRHKEMPPRNSHLKQGKKASNRKRNKEGKERI